MEPLHSRERVFTLQWGKESLPQAPGPRTTGRDDWSCSTRAPEVILTSAYNHVVVITHFLRETSPTDFNSITFLY